MTVNRKPTGMALSIPTGITIGILVSVFITLSTTFLGAKLVDAEIVSMDKVGYMVLTIIIISSWIGVMTASRKIKRRRILVSLLTGTIYFGTLLVVTGMFFGGQYSGVGETALLIFCGSILGFISGRPSGNKRRRCIKKKYNW